MAALGWPNDSPAMRKTAMACTKAAAWFSRLLAAAAISSTRAAFCCVPWSMTVTASAMCCTPRLCSSLDALISPIRAVTRRMASTTSVIVAPASLTCVLPW